jgi:hypothetical protein
MGDEGELHHSHPGSTTPPTSRGLRHHLTDRIVKKPRQLTPERLSDQLQD